MKNSKRLIPLIAFFAAVLSLASVETSSAQTGKTKRVRFARGASSAVLKGAVLRGSEDRFIVPAKAGQTMRVKIVSIETNANFTVYFAGEMESLPDSERATEWTQTLSDDNNYVIIVAPTRGNAVYSLRIEIE